MSRCGPVEAAARADGPACSVRTYAGTSDVVARPQLLADQFRQPPRLENRARNAALSALDAAGQGAVERPARHQDAAEEDRRGERLRREIVTTLGPAQAVRTIRRAPATNRHIRRALAAGSARACRSGSGGSGASRRLRAVPAARGRSRVLTKRSGSSSHLMFERAVAVAVAARLIRGPRLASEMVASRTPAIRTDPRA